MWVDLDASLTQEYQDKGLMNTFQVLFTVTYNHKVRFGVLCI